jgi:hypothetical protein
LQIEGRHIVLTDRTRIYSHHADRSADYDFDHPIGEIATHPTNPAAWGLRNLTDRAWTAHTPDGRSWPIPPQRSVSIIDGLTVDFATGTGRFITSAAGDS